VQKAHSFPRPRNTPTLNQQPLL